jgi:hypothetical protein
MMMESLDDLNAYERDRDGEGPPFVALKDVLTSISKQVG